MPFTLIKGTFHAVGFRPDGDTLRFRARDIENWEKLDGPRPRISIRDNTTSLRFEAIDTLETHYLPRGSRAPSGEKEVEQPQPFANNGTDFTLSEAGIMNVMWGENRRGGRSRVLSAMDGTNGFVLTRGVDNPRFRRPVAFVFAGTTRDADGSSKFLDVDLLRKSINFRLAAEGMAYPTYYEDLCRLIDLRDAITNVVVDARKKSKALWGIDMSSGLTVNGLERLTTTDVVMPKLFRRLAEYLTAINDDVTGFKAWVKSRDEEIMVLSSGLIGTFDQVIFEDGKRIGLETVPEDIVFMS